MRETMPQKPSLPQRRHLARLPMALALLAGLGACATTREVQLSAAAGEPMNPSRNGVSSVLDVYAFFLKKREGFDGKDRRLADFLTDDVRRNNKAPAFLEQDVVAVQKLKVVPQKDGKQDLVLATVTVPLEAGFVGLVADFQGHKDNDEKEVWRLVLDTTEGSAKFYVVEKKLSLPPEKSKEPEKPKPESSKPESSKDGSSEKPANG